jgi:tight adherence protein B
VTALFALLGTGIGAGAWLAWSCARPGPRPGRSRARHRAGTFRQRALLAGGGALIALAATRWPVPILAGAGVGWAAPDLLGGRSRRQATVDRAVAVASWAEMLRDTLAASSGLEEAIAVTGPLAPPSIRPAVSRLVADLSRVRLAEGLRRLADELADPTADLVVSALVLAARGQAQNLVDLLGSLASAAREDADMRLRVDAARARVRTSVRVIAVITVVMVALLVVFNGGYLRPFGSPGGQVMLAVIFVGFAGGLLWLQRMARYQAPDRFLARPQAAGR